ncbi:MAG: GDSL-type esterase/lipase family protein [Acidobacteria bacterium]|nr:GDSL-type esterase/lipase family protein [Acidobacteriota bacterium]
MTLKTIFTTLIFSTALTAQKGFDTFGPTVLRVAFMGDSFAAGEGSPNLTGDKWTSPHTACHNSDENGRSAAARRIQAALGPSSNFFGRRLEFIDVACSGATINGSVIGENYRGPTPLTPSGPGPVGPPIPSQVSQVRQWLNGKELDLLIISVGGNDIGFGEIVAKCMTPLTSCKDDPALETIIRRGKQGNTEFVGLDFLAGAYTTMKNRIDADLKPKAVAIIGVPNPVRDQDNRYCHRYEDGVGILPSNLLDPFNHPFVQMVGLSTIGTLSPAEVDRGESEWIEATVINPLNAKLEQIANNFRTSNWSYIDIDYMTKLHGICSDDAWFNTFKTSLATQGDFNGVAHPKRAGYKVYEAFTFRLLARHFNVRVSAAPRIDQENIHLSYVINGDTKTMPPSEYNLNPDRVFVGNNFSLRFRSLVFPSPDVMTSLTLQISRKPFADSTAADISNFPIDISSATIGNFSKNVAASNFSDGATRHVRWRSITRLYYDADAETTTSFSSTVRIKVKDGINSARKL